MQMSIMLVVVQQIFVHEVPRVAMYPCVPVLSGIFIVTLTRG